MENCPHCKKDPRPEELVSNLQKRLKKISGQINGVSKMVDETVIVEISLFKLLRLKARLKKLVISS